MAGVAMLMAAGITAQAQFTYTTNNGTITISGYIGSGGVVTIPPTIHDFPVTNIGTNAFEGSIHITNSNLL